MGRTQRKRRSRKRTFESLKCDPALINLFKWLNFNKWRNVTKLYPARFEPTGRGLTSKRRIEKNATLIEIPFNVLITYATLKHSKLFLQIDRTAKITIHEALTAFLIYEKNKKENSLWFEYISMIPNHYISAIYCTENEINLLPDALKMYILNQRDKITKSFANIQIAFKNSDISDLLTPETLFWAYWTVNTRAVYIEPEVMVTLAKFLPLNEIFPMKLNGSRHVDDVTVNYDFLKGEPNMALAPLIDLFNHSTYTDTKAHFSSNLSHFKLVTQSKFAPYDEYLISYGPHNNLKLLCEYGFIIRRNQFDTIPLEVDTILKIGGIELNHRRRVYIFTKFELDKELYFSYDGLSYNLFTLLYILTHENATQWNYKIYTNDYTNVEKQLIYKLAKKIGENRLKEFTEIKKNIEEYREQNNVCQFFQITVDYVQECINLINFVIEEYCNKYV